jgi:ferredoxin/flavodoxin---NADP+ reductase
MGSPIYLRGMVVERRDLTPQLWIVRIQPEEKLTFTPGQYVTIGLPRGPKIIERPYSLASGPKEAELEFFLELVPGGQLSPLLYEVGVCGEVLIRRAAKGRFAFDRKSMHSNHLMIATVTGVAPYVSMLRDMTQNPGEQRPGDSVLLLQGAATSTELGYREELAAHERQCEWFRYVPSLSRRWLEPDWQGEAGRVDDIVRKYADAFGFTAERTTAYLCGNPLMIGSVSAILQRAGFARESIREEMYWPAARAGNPVA